MSRREPIPRLTLTEKHTVIFADLVCGAPIKQTMEATSLSKTQIINVRNRIKRFLHKDFDHNKLRKRVLGLAPLVVKNITQYLLEGDKEVTLKCAEGFGFLFKNHEDLMEMLAALAANRGDTHVTVINTGGDADAHAEDDSELSAIFAQSRNASRFQPDDN